MSFISETKVKAVKRDYLCDGCGQTIDVGSPAVRWAGLTDGQFGTAIYHPDCREAEDYLNREIYNSQWDEWINLANLEREDWQTIHDRFPAVARRMGITERLEARR